MRRALITLIVITSLIWIPRASAEDTVILDRFTQEEAEILDIQIPDDTPAGYHEAVIEVTDENDQTTSKILAFCKTSEGEISWDNECPDVSPLLSAEELSVIESRDDLPPYSPTQEPEETVETQVAAFALISAVAAGAAALGQVASNSRSSSGATRRREKEEEEEERESGDLASASAGKLKFAKREVAWGDSSRVWKIGYREGLERKFVSWTEKVSAFSPILARIFLDGSYLRAMLSSFSMLPSLSGIVIGFLILQDTGFQALPPSFFLVAIALLISTIDAFAGLWISTVVLVGTLVTGNARTLDEVMTVLGVSAILLTPGLMASAIRPFRRHIEDSESAWERITDYLLAILLGGWAVEKIVGSLNGLAGVQLPITSSSEQLGLLASFFILIRLAFEDLATYLFPERLASQEAKLRNPVATQPYFSLAFQASLFAVVAYQFLGVNLQLILGTLLFIVPSLFKIWAGKVYLKKTAFLHFLLPKGTPKIVIMVFVGAFFASWVQGLFASPSDFITWSFVVLAIPGLLLSLLGNFSTTPKRDWKKSKIGRYVYRLGGIAIAALVFAMYQGVNLYKAVFGG
jgi:hypothetical protein